MAEKYFIVYLNNGKKVTVSYDPDEEVYAEESGLFPFQQVAVFYLKFDPLMLTDEDRQNIYKVIDTKIETEFLSIARLFKGKQLGHYQSTMRQVIFVYPVG